MTYWYLRRSGGVNLGATMGTYAGVIIVDYRDPFPTLSLKHQQDEARWETAVETLLLVFSR